MAPVNEEGEDIIANLNNYTQPGTPIPEFSCMNQEPFITPNNPENLSVKDIHYNSPQDTSPIRVSPKPSREISPVGFLAHPSLESPSIHAPADVLQTPVQDRLPQDVPLLPSIRLPPIGPDTRPRARLRPRAIGQPLHGPLPPKLPQKLPPPPIPIKVPLLPPPPTLPSSAVPQNNTPTRLPPKVPPRSSEMRYFSPKNS